MDYRYHSVMMVMGPVQKIVIHTSIIGCKNINNSRSVQNYFSSLSHHSLGTACFFSPGPSTATEKA